MNVVLIGSSVTSKTVFNDIEKKTDYVIIYWEFLKGNVANAYQSVTRQ